MKGPGARGRVVNEIRALRTARKMTQAALADAAGATRQTIIAVEAGKYSPSLELAFRISRVLEAPFEQVFSYRED